IATQLASVVIDQVQSRVVTIVTAPCPPAAAKVDGALVALTEHRSAVGAVTDVSALVHAIARAALEPMSSDTTRNPQRIRFNPCVRKATSRPGVRAGRDSWL